MTTANQMLIAAYSAGAHNGGSVDWQDLDDAYNQALREEGMVDNTLNAGYILAARARHGSDGECEIDDNAVVSRGEDPGAYVQAWVWVDDDDVLPEADLDEDALTTEQLADKGFADPREEG